MKTVGKRSWFLLLLVLLFAAGMGLFLVRLGLHGSDWVSQPYNGHLDGENCVIEDAKGRVIFSGGVYEGDYDARLAMLHTLGDGNGYISTGLRTTHRSALSGYNIFTGLTGGEAALSLTVDSKLCAHAYALLDGRNGAVFIYNYKTGAVVCKTSSLSYDPLDPPSTLETDPFYEGVFLDRTLSASFAPGSVFKVITAICAMENLPDWEDYTCECDGSVLIGGEEITCMGIHGTEDIRNGLIDSCNVIFAQLAVDLGPEKMQETAEKLGFGISFDFEGADTKRSSFDVSKAKSHELAWAGVGQYTDLVTPYHMAVLMGSVANGGQSAKPYLVRSSAGSLGLPTYLPVPQKLSRLMPEEIADQMKECLRADVTESYGDERFPEGMQICAKTGTAQVGNNKEDTAWIAGFSANPETPYAFAVVVEEGGFGLSTAGSILSSLLEDLAE